MLVDLQKNLKKMGDLFEIVQDNYELVNGVYVIINEKGNFNVININEDVPYFPELEWLKKADYFSYLLDMNKAVDDKKQIHSCNPYSVFIKLDRLPVVKGAKKTATQAELIGFIKYYFSVFRKDVKGRYTTEGVKTLKAAKLPELKTEELTKCKTLILDKFESILNEVGLIESIPKNSYLKIFIATDIEKYRQEWMRYIIPKIFNKNDYNEEVNGEIYGLSNFNMGMNSKKPYLALHTTNFKVPFRIDLEDSMNLKYIFDWLKSYKNSNQKEVNSMYLSDQFKMSDDLDKFSDGYYVHFERGKSLEITDYDYIPQAYGKEKYHLFNITNLDKWDKKDNVDIRELEVIVNDLFFNKFLIKNYYTQPSDIRDKYSETDYSRNLLIIMVIYRDALFNFFRKNDNTSIIKCFDKMTTEIVIEYIKISSGAKFYKAAGAYNLRISLLEHFKIGGEENMPEILTNYYAKVKEKMISKDKLAICEDDKEFFYTAGQLTSYLLSMSAAKDLKHSAADVITNAKNVKIIKSKLMDLFFFYNHAISKNNTRFNNLFSMVMGYESDSLTKEYMDYFLAGMTSKNVLFEKKEDKIS